MGRWAVARMCLVLLMAASSLSPVLTLRTSVLSSQPAVAFSNEEPKLVDKRQLLNSVREINSGCIKGAQMYRYSRCGGLAKNDLPVGVTEGDVVDTCFAQCPAGTTCYKQNQWYWQCLPDEPDDPAWNKRTCECSDEDPNKPNPSPDDPVPEPSPAPIPTPSPDIPVPLPPIETTVSTQYEFIYSVYSFYFNYGISIEETFTNPDTGTTLTPFLEKYAKCGNEYPYYQLDLCKEGLTCVRKDATFMQCLELPPQPTLTEGTNCGVKYAYDIYDKGETVSRCPSGTACMSTSPEIQDVADNWQCRKTGYYQSDFLTNGQCLAYGSKKGVKSCPGAQVCVPLDPYFGMCLEYATFNEIAVGEQCGTSKPYDGDFKDGFCGSDSRCAPAADSIDGSAITKFVCIAADSTYKLEDGVKCGDEEGPYNGATTCDTVGGADGSSTYSLCWQNVTSDWRCVDTDILNYKDDKQVCGTGTPYSEPTAFCSGLTSSCFLQSVAKLTYQCYDGCPSSWDCAKAGITEDYFPKDGCGPVSDEQFLSTLGEALTGEAYKPCAEGSYCVAKDVLGLYQCVPAPNIFSPGRK